MFILELIDFHVSNLLLHALSLILYWFTVQRLYAFCVIVTNIQIPDVFMMNTSAIFLFSCISEDGIPVLERDAITVKV